MKKDIVNYLNEEKSIKAQISNLEQKQSNNTILPGEVVVLGELYKQLAEVNKKIANY